VITGIKIMWNELLERRNLAALLLLVWLIAIYPVIDIED
jgi:hypothetical protein